MASGAVSSTANTRAPGSSARSTSHAAATPTTAHSGTVTATSPTVLTSSSATRGPNRSRDSVGQPVTTAVRATCPSGTSPSTVTSPAASRIVAGPLGPRELMGKASQQAGPGHQVGDLGAVQLGGVHPGCLQLSQRHQGGVRGDTASHRVLKRAPGPEDVLPALARDERQERLSIRGSLAGRQHSTTRDADERTGIGVLEVVQLGVLT